METRPRPDATVAPARPGFSSDGAKLYFHSLRRSGQLTTIIQWNKIKNKTKNKYQAKPGGNLREREEQIPLSSESLAPPTSTTSQEANDRRKISSVPRQDGAERLSTYYDSRDDTLLSPAVNASRSLVVKGKQKEQENPTGLQVVFEPDSPRKFDIIFVHGLGGTSRFTWSWNKDIRYFWPKEWLPLEPDIKEGRVLTFGYDAGINTPRSFKNVSDFAKDLLFDMKFAKDGAAEDLGLGKVCAIAFHLEGGKSVNSFASCPSLNVPAGVVHSSIALRIPGRSRSMYQASWEAKVKLWSCTLSRQEPYDP